MRFRLLLVLCLISNASSLRAEGGCPPGQAPQQGAGWRSCVPLSNGTNTHTHGASSASRRWTARWASVAIDEEKLIVSKSTGHRSEEQAERFAIDGCVSQGGSSCRAVGTGKNGCIALVMGETRYAAKGAPTLQEAEDKAMSSCKNHSDRNCSVYETACAWPVLE